MTDFEKSASTNKRKLIRCSLPRKSLVKGERFIRFEKPQELLSCNLQNSLQFISPYSNLIQVFKPIFPLNSTLKTQNNSHNLFQNLNSDIFKRRFKFLS